MTLRNWFVDYGQGPKLIEVPHAWRQDVPVAWEGPALYWTDVLVPNDAGSLRFLGVSYRAEVRIEGVRVCVHEGIWDAFDIDLAPWRGKSVRVEVEVVKNGAATYPVREVLSGFLPYVFHTFGGIFREVVVTSEPLEPPRAANVRRPGYVRGLLTWGWYPELGHHHPDEATIREEVRKAKALGFNLVKFCLWMPPHRYLEILEEEGMLAWMELPLWDPADSDAVRERLRDELGRIVRQYRRHGNIAIWTVGCELSSATPPEFRAELVEMVRAETGCTLVKDNSGGSEMYGGSLLEFGDFHDYHPYCDLPFYGPVLESLLNGPRKKLPIYLGEFNDIDVHRDLPRILEKKPFWSSPDPVPNPQGVRWQHDLPYFLPKTPLARDVERSGALQESSRRKALFIRKSVHELVRQHEDIAGYVVTGWRDTPISTAGFFDDYGDARFSPEECAAWNGEACLFRIPTRRPPWVDGGNRPGWRSLSCFFSDQEAFVRLGAAGPLAGAVRWELLPIRTARHLGSPIGADAEVGRGWAGEAAGGPQTGPRHLAELSFGKLPAGDYLLRVEADGTANDWTLKVTDRLAVKPEFLEPGATVACPFWREAAYEFHGVLQEVSEDWHLWLDVSPDRAIDPEWLSREHPDAEVLLNRIDTRTYVELPVLAVSAGQVISTISWDGGLGSQPQGWGQNPAAHALARLLTGQTGA